MLLELTYQDKAQGPVLAAIIPGSDPMVWVAELSRWGLAPSELRCFILPESISQPGAGGLFVIFSNHKAAKNLLLQYPYMQPEDGFYIPVHSTLVPQLLPGELKSVKLWDIQVFHPAIGLVGFESKDELQLHSLLQPAVQSGREWLAAVPAPQAYPRLMSIRLEPDENAVDAVAALEALIDKQELDSIPQDESDKKTILQKLLRVLEVIGLWLLLILAFIGRIIFAILSA